MKSITKWAETFDVEAKPWLMLGKGPSFERISDVRTEEYYICSLNHVVRELPVTLAHIIDIDVVPNCASAIENNAQYLLLPWHPHVNCTASSKTLADFVSELPVLARMESQGRLLCYNLYSGRRFEPYPDTPTVMVRYFSAEAALNILAESGATTIRSLGVDGGNRYSLNFKDLESTTLLANSRENFDQQFQTISETIRKTGILYGPLYIDCPARIFIGCPDTHVIPAKVLEYSLRKHASLTLEIAFVKAPEFDDCPLSPELALSGRSFAPFKVPELCDHDGRAIYLDPNAIALGDIAELWTQSMGDNHLLFSNCGDAHPRELLYSTMMLDCASLSWRPAQIASDIRTRRLDASGLLGDFSIVSEPRKAMAVPDIWNSPEVFDDKLTRLVRFSNFPVFPWISARNPLQPLWIRYLQEAIDEGFIDTPLLYEEIFKGHLAPKLPRWIGLADPPGYDRLMAEWVPPHARSRPVDNNDRDNLLASRIGRMFRKLFKK